MSEEDAPKMNEEFVRKELVRRRIKALLDLVTALSVIFIAFGLLLWLAPYTLAGSGEPEPKWLYSIVKTIAKIGAVIGLFGLILRGTIFEIMARAGDDDIWWWWRR